jgi:hypothetical protein
MKSEEVQQPPQEKEAKPRTRPRERKQRVLFEAEADGKLWRFAFDPGNKTLAAWPNRAKRKHILSIDQLVDAATGQMRFQL